MSSGAMGVPFRAARRGDAATAARTEADVHRDPSRFFGRPANASKGRVSPAGKPS